MSIGGIWMRAACGLLAAGLVGCGDHGDLPVRAPSIRVASDHPLADVLWPSLLQHCRRNPSCDPMSAFGLGAGEASGVAGYSTWFAERADVLEDGERFGARVRVSLEASRGEGGEAGRPLKSSELEPNLRALRDGRSRLTIEYRERGGQLVPYFVSIRTQQVVLDVPGLSEETPRDELVAATRSEVEGWSWPGGERGAEIFLSQEGEVLLAVRSTGGPSRTTWKGEEPEAIGFEPWVFAAQLELEDGGVAPLVAALKGDGFVRLTVRAPDGGVVLRDAFAAGGHEAALAEAVEALADAKVREPLTERCAAFAGWDNDDWAIANVSPAEATCDPLTSVSRQRILDQQPSASPM